MIVIDEYLAMRVVFASDGWPTDLPDTEDLVLPASRHWRLLQCIHGPGGGQLSPRPAALTPAARDTLRFSHPEVLHRRQLPLGQSIAGTGPGFLGLDRPSDLHRRAVGPTAGIHTQPPHAGSNLRDRKSTRLNSSHLG